MFEAPREAAPGLAIQLSSGRLGIRMDALAEIPHGIDRAGGSGCASERGQRLNAPTSDSCR